MTGDMPATSCQWCGCYHDAVCPRATAIEYYPNGMLKRVEFGGRVERVAALPEPPTINEGTSSRMI